MTHEQPIFGAEAVLSLEERPARDVAALISTKSRVSYELGRDVR